LTRPSLCCADPRSPRHRDTRARATATFSRPTRAGSSAGCGSQDSLRPAVRRRHRASAMASRRMRRGTAG
jgi:hypothetical protein